MMENLFPEDRYDTPDNTPRCLPDRLSLNSRWWFYIKNFYVFYRTGKTAARGELTRERQIAFSNMNVRLVESCGGRIHLRGLNHLSGHSGPVMLIGNHMSLLETALFHAIVRPRIDFTFVIKRSLLKVPYFGWIMRDLGAIAVDRENARDDFKIIMTEGKKLFAAGRSLILFPQATRSEQFIPEKFNTVGIKLARAAGIPVIPFALKTDFLANGRLIRDLGPIRRERAIHFEFGEPLSVTGSGKEEHQRIIDFITARLREWSNLTSTSL